MFWALFVAELALVELHATGGNLVYVNPHEITSVREPLPGNRTHFAEGTRCVVFLTNRNIISVRDTCDYVRDHLMHPITPP